ncbi:hypothetical protein OSTOST_06269 [Ostertagia ostertagi]
MITSSLRCRDYLQFRKEIDGPAACQERTSLLMYSHYPRQVCVDSSIGGGAATFRSSPRALITYEVVEAQQDDVMQMTNAAQHQHLQNSPSVPENSLDSTDSIAETPRLSPQHRRIALRNRARKTSTRQMILDEDEMLKIPSPEKLNSMMRGVELNVYATGTAPHPHTPQTPQPPYTPNGSRFSQPTASPHYAADMRSPPLMSPTQAPMAPQAAMPRPVSNGTPKCQQQRNPYGSTRNNSDEFLGQSSRRSYGISVHPDICLAGCVLHMFDMDRMFTDKLDLPNIVLAIRMHGGDIEFGAKAYAERAGAITHVIVESIRTQHAHLVRSLLSSLVFCFMYATGTAPHPHTPQTPQPPYTPNGSRFSQPTASPHYAADMRSPPLMSPTQAPMAPQAAMPRPVSNGEMVTQPIRMVPTPQQPVIPSQFFTYEPNLLMNVHYSGYLFGGIYVYCICSTWIACLRINWTYQILCWQSECTAREYRIRSKGLCGTSRGDYARHCRVYKNPARPSVRNSENSAFSTLILLVAFDERRARDEFMWRPWDEVTRTLAVTIIFLLLSPVALKKSRRHVNGISKWLIISGWLTTMLVKGWKLIITTVSVAWKMPLIVSPEQWRRSFDTKQAVENDEGVFPNKKLRKEHKKSGTTHPAYVVAFSGIDDENKHVLTQKLRYLGGRACEEVSECTHLVTTNGRRTERLLEAICLGKNIVNPYWIVHGYECRQWMDTLDYFLHDEDQERHLGYNCKRSVVRARHKKDVQFYITPSVEPSRAVLTKLIRLAGGTVHEDRPAPADIAVYNTDMILIALMRQELEPHPLYRVSTASLARPTPAPSSQPPSTPGHPQFRSTPSQPQPHRVKA